MISLNKAYEPYELAATEIREIWKFVHYISRDVAEPPLTENLIGLQLKELTEEIKGLKQKIENR
jgi:hypothetical protein